METSQGHITTLDLALPVFLPGSNRDWSEFAGVARITDKGEIFIQFQNEKANTALVQMALDKILLQVSFDYRLTSQQLKELNERYTKKIVSKVGSYPIMSGDHVMGEATILTDGKIELKLENDENPYVIDTAKKVDRTATITTPIKK